MKLEQLLKKYSDSDNTLQILEKLRSPGNSHVHLKGLVGSFPSFVLTTVAAQLKKVHLCVLPDQEGAAYFLNDLENLLGKSSVLFFPSSGRKPYEHSLGDSSSILLRAEVLNYLLQGAGDNDTPIVVVTYPEALAEKVVTRSHLSKNTLQVLKGEKLSVDFVIDLLLEYGFNRVDYVVEPGQFSVRGGIIDVFSFSSDDPYRVELSGDEVESIRSFDAVSQLSVEQLDKINVIPNIQTKLLRESRQSFLEYIPAETVLWLNDLELISDIIHKEVEQAVGAYEKLETLIDQLPPSELFIDRETFLNQVKAFSTIEFGNRFFLNADLVLTYDLIPQPAFKKNFGLLMADLDEKSKSGFSNIIFFDTVKQAERLHNIFKDIAVKEEVFDPLAVQSKWEGADFSIHEGFVDKQNKIACYSDHQIFERYHRFRLKNAFSKTNEAITLKELKGLNPGDYITHIDHGIGRYGGLEKMEVNGKLQEAIRLVYKDNDILYVSIHSLHRISKYGGKEGAIPKIDKLGSNAWQNLKQKTKRKVKEIAFDLIKLYAERKAKKGFAFAPDNYLQNELEASFIYEDTPDQLKATRDVKRDMEDPAPMDRLVCGDVGFGKTEIAIRAVFKAAIDGKQSAVLVPTTILALQHYRTFSERLKGMPCTVDYINRFKSAKEQKETLEKLAEGKIDIIIGTHRIVGKDVKFKDLGLLVIDEEQKFGVGVKDKLKTIKTNVDTLTLTATPIPRTLQFSMMGARDLSIINTAPPNRYPVQTELHSFNHELIRDAIMYEVSRGGQVFFIHNRVGTLAEIELLINKLCPNVRVLTAHGQMDGDKLEEAMMHFVDGDYNVLVSTTIVESGLDIPNANTMIINDAHTFGLSDLHQLRGRVGRSNKKAFCYLLAPPQSVLTSEAQKRLRAISEFSDLGSGFQIAMRDLDIRGAGNLLGAEQSGFITEIGYEMYQKILDEAMEELREEMELRDEGRGTRDKGNNVDAPRLASYHMTAVPFIKDCQIDTDLEILIPDSYVSNITERLGLYRELDDSKTENNLSVFESKLKDRFGPVPVQTKELINTVRLRWAALNIGFEKIILKNNKLVGYFISKKDSPYYQSPVFSAVLKYVQQNQRSCKMKEGNNKLTLTFENIKTIDIAIVVIKKIVSNT
ncbi:MAG: transcription-repair coupling factor [Bacteroidia bacterium]|nr:transcription-repair coupling factor [Bacteroidia bacterium]